MNKNIHLRPRIQREFLSWYQQNAHRFAIPLRLMKRTHERLDIDFLSISPVITASLFSTNIGVYAKANDCYIDCLVDIDIYLRHTTLGYFCAQCDPESPDFYPTRSAIWQAHQFERFLTWVNETLAPARWIRLSVDDGSSWATLIRDEQKISKPDAGLILMKSLKKLDGSSAYEDAESTFQHFLVPLRTDRAWLRSNLGSFAMEGTTKRSAQ